MVLLEHQGATVIAVGSVREGVQTLETFTPDVLLSNIHLPDGLGTSVLQKLRDRSAELDNFTPAIALTGEALEIARTDPALAGFEIYISKPFDSEALVKVIENLVS